MKLDFNYGLIVIDPAEKAPQQILHFMGYDDFPTNRDEALLRIELRDDPELGLQEIWDKVDILLAPDSVLDEYRIVINTNTEINENRDV